AAAQDSTFSWNLPAPSAVQKITAANFPDADAVILLKEQGFTEGPHTKSVFVITDEVTVSTKAIIVKLLNQKAVEEFGSFSYEFPYYLNREARHQFVVHARVMKPDGTVWVLPDTAIKNATGISSGRGRKLTEKVMYKIPNLAPGDIVQYEYAHRAPFSFRRQVLFFYHDRYPVLRSVVSVDMTKREKVKYVHFPPDKIGAPAVRDLGRSTLSSWSVTNLGAIPDEPFGRPFGDVSYLTTIVGADDPDDPGGWHTLGKNYYRDNIAEGSIPKSFMTTLGFDPAMQNAAWTDIDSLYTAIRKYFRLEALPSLYTNFRGVDKQIEDKEGDASDMCFLMLKALDRWGIPATPLLVRDRRDGVYELSVPSTVWFDRLALLVRYKGKDQVYDFDRSIPSRYEIPWFITPSIMFAVQDTGGHHIQFRVPSNWREHISMEDHHITLTQGKRAVDSAVFMLKGALAEHERGSLYARSGEELDASLRDYLGHTLHDVEHAGINDFRDNPVILISGDGPSRGASTAIDSFVTFQPRNYLLRSFRERFSQPVRRFDVTLDEPFGIVLSWHIQGPNGSHPVHPPEAAEIHGPAGAMAQVYTFAQGSDVDVKASVVFSTATIPVSEYGRWRTFLDSVNTTAERDIAFALGGK
ncbi:MAG TPA: DUF3857 domain-containing protein, partial [Bacteroidota bacterium]|nr:DUF3857 domain-containing protein [Bacteroidota bacterium]